MCSVHTNEHLIPVVVLNGVDKGFVCLFCQLDGTEDLLWGVLWGKETKKEGEQVGAEGGRERGRKEERGGEEERKREGKKVREEEGR